MNDLGWRSHIDSRLNSQDESLHAIKDSLEDRRGHIDRRLNLQDEALHAIKGTLEEHIESERTIDKKIEPILDAMHAMQTGIKVIGWIGSKVTAVSLLVAAAIGAIAAWKGFRF